MILSVIFGSLSLFGMEVLALKPLWYPYGALFFLILSIASAFAGERPFSFKNFLRETVIFCLFFAGLVTVMFYLENAVMRQILAVVFSAVYAGRIFRWAAGEKRTIINFLFCIFLSFIVSAALFGLDLFFAVPVSYLTAAAFIAGYLIFLEIAAVAGEPNQALPVFGAVFWGEIFFVMLMLPNAFYLGSAVITIFTFLFGEIFYIKRFMPHSALRLAIFSVILLLILFLTAKWI
jgi:hypothetical protein